MYMFHVTYTFNYTCTHLQFHMLNIGFVLCQLCSCKFAYCVIKAFVDGFFDVLKLKKN